MYDWKTCCTELLKPQLLPNVKQKNKEKKTKNNPFILKLTPGILFAVSYKKLCMMS